MGLFGRLPGITLELPAVLVAGHSHAGVVVLDIREPAGAGRLVVRLLRQEEEALSRVLDGALRLDAVGVQRVSFQLKLPRDMVPSYDLPGESNRYRVEVVLEGPWVWRSARASLPVEVRLPVAEQAQARLIEVKAPHETPLGERVDSAVIELIVDSDTQPPGGVLAGQVALVGVPRSYQSLEVYFNQCLGDGVGDRFGAEVQRSVLIAHFTDEDGFLEGNAQEFELRVPDASQPSFRHTERSLFYEVEARCNIDPNVQQIPFWSACATVEVVDPSVRVLGPERTRPALGRAREDGKLAEIAGQLRMTCNGRMLGFVDGDTRLSVGWYLDRRSRVLRLAADLSFPSLGLGLRTGRGSLLGVFSSRRVREHGWPVEHLEAREPAQASWFLGQIGHHVGLFSSATLGDTAIRLESPQREGRELFELVRAARLVAQGVTRAREEIPPPEALADALPAWEALARSLGGRLHRGPMAVEGRIDPFELRLETCWGQEGEPAGTALTVRDPALPGPAMRLGEEEAQAAQAEVQRLLGPGASFSLDDGQARFVWPEVIRGAEEAERQVRALVRVVERLQPRGAPYR